MSLPRSLLAALSATLALSCSAGPRSSAPATAPSPSAPAGATASPSAAPTTLKRVVVSMGRPSGSSVMTVAADGTITTSLEVLENGRGPRTDATIALAPDGTLASLTAKGHHTFGATFQSTFARTGDHARWDSEEEKGERDVQGIAFYLPVATIPELSGFLVQAALRNGGTIPLLPEGTARVEKSGETTVTVGGKAHTLVGYDIIGLDLTPVPIWMNPDGTWFGYVSEWFSVVPEGWESVIDPLVAKQREWNRARDARLAAELGHKPPAAGLAYTHARVLDVERGRWLADQTVVVVGDTITSVGPSKSAKIPAGAEVVDLAGKALLPGMIDMHVHLSEDGVLHVASGVTTVRDVGNDPDMLDDLQRRYDEGTAIGPRIVRFGFIEGRNEKAASSKITAETPEEALAAVKFYADRKYEGVKIYNSVRPNLVPIIAEAAHKSGLQVTGHVPVHMLANEAVRAGYDGIEHINMLFLNFFATHETDTRDTTRFTLVGDKAADFDLTSKPVRDFLKLLRARKTIITPTNNAFEDLLVGEQGRVIPGLEKTVARLPAQTRRRYLLGGLPLDAEKRVRYKASFEKTLAMTKALYDAKVRIAPGTDAMAGLMYHHELVLWVRAGIPAAAVLRLATLESARYLGKDKKTGSIARGKAADLVVVDGDPLANIDDIGRTVSTMRGGVVFSSAKLYASVGVEPYEAARP